MFLFVSFHFVLFIVIYLFFFIQHDNANSLCSKIEKILLAHFSEDIISTFTIYASTPADLLVPITHASIYSLYRLFIETPPNLPYVNHHRKYIERIQASQDYLESLQRKKQHELVQHKETPSQQENDSSELDATADNSELDSVDENDDYIWLSENLKGTPSHSQGIVIND